MSPGTWVIINLLGGVALLLWGVRMVRTGIMRAWGERVQHTIESHLDNRLSAFVAGAGATLFLQSSTATALIVTGLAAAGAVGGATGLAVLLGADLGSAVVTAIVAGAGPVITNLSPFLIFAGYLTFSLSSQFKPRNAGRIMLGLGLMLLALKLIVAAGQPLREATLFHTVLEAIGQEPFLALLAGALLTWMSYSSLASILLISSLLVSGAMEPQAAYGFILGVNFGAGLPALSSTADQPRAARRLPAANLAARALMAVVLVPWVPFIAEKFALYVSDPVWQAVSFHAGFNLVLAMIALPLAGFIVSTVRNALPDEPAQQDGLEQPRYLDNRVLETPSIAFHNAQMETVRMTELLDRMFATAANALRSGDLEALKAVKHLDERLNTYHSSIHAYLAAISNSELKGNDDERVHDIMLFISNLEHAGDIIHLSLAARIKSKAKLGVEFTSEQTASITHLCDTVQASLKIAMPVLATGDIAAARRLIEQKAAFRSHENTVIDEHFRSSRMTGSTRRDDIKASALYVDLIRDLHQINSHIVSAAYPVLEAAGMLRETRVKKKAKAG